MSQPSAPATAAVIDVGSGSVKLLITGRDGLTEPSAELVHTAVKTRLIDGDGRLADDALAATAEAFAGFQAAIAEHRPDVVTVVATAVGRRLEDPDGLARLVTETFGVPLEVISGEREALLALAGAAAGRQADGPAGLIDIGAGSTEFAVRTPGGPTATFSMPLGGRTVTAAYLDTDPPRPEELSAALSVIELHLDDLRREVPGYLAAVEDGTIFGTGAMTQIAEVEIGLPDPDAASVDGYRLERVGAEEVFRAIATEAAADRIHNPGLRPEHNDDVIGAMCVLVEFLRQLGVDEVTISERGLMHGLAAEILAER